MKVGLVVIATNKYIRFAQPLYESMKKYLLNEPGIERKMFLLTNQPDFFRGPVYIRKVHEPWPYITLRRYEMFLKHSNYFHDMDYLFYCDADMLFVNRVGREILGETVATIHPTYWNASRDEFPYETNPASTAYIAPGQGTRYFFGSFQGGRTSAFLNMSRILHKNITKDLHNGIIAVWHDESHMNRYMMEHPPAVELSPAYGFPEAAWARDLPFPKIIMALDKNHEEMRRYS
jgi:histo-blood group ABO system transferase